MQTFLSSSLLKSTDCKMTNYQFQNLDWVLYNIKMCKPC